MEEKRIRKRDIFLDMIFHALAWLSPLLAQATPKDWKEAELSSVVYIPPLTAETGHNSDCTGHDRLAETDHTLHLLSTD